MTKVQIVMPCINLWQKYTLPAIESIETAMVSAKKHNIDCRLVLIDNASSDETKLEASKRVGANFQHKRNEERWGFQRSVNYGVEDGWGWGADYAFICNNDILVHPEAIWRLVEAFDEEHQADGRTLDVGMITAMDVRGETQPGAFTQMNPNEKANVPVSVHPNFSAFMLNRMTWETVGEMDEVFFPAYFEDNDFHHRMKLAGLDAIVLPTALFYHFGSGTQNEGNENKLPLVPGPMFENNRAAYAKKWGGVPGDEKYDRPYNDFLKDITSTKQKP